VTEYVRLRLADLAGQTHTSGRYEICHDHEHGAIVVRKGVPLEDGQEVVVLFAAFVNRPHQSGQHPDYQTALPEAQCNPALTFTPKQETAP